MTNFGKNDLFIDELKISPPVMLAPMAGVSDRPFRILCKEMGMGMCYTEFVSSEGIIRDNEKTREYMKFTEAERPIGIQIFGADPQVMAEAARRVEKDFRPDLIDLNYGCPVPKVVKKGAGAAMLKDMDRMVRVAEAVVKAVSLPVTVKMRSGWKASQIISMEAARRLEGVGVRAITLHPRTAEMKYTGHSDWNEITRVRQAVSIPVIGNGDIHNRDDAASMMSETGCDAVMVGRAALGNPWIFRDLAALFSGADLPAGPTIEERLDMILRHLSMMQEDYGNQAYKIFKSHYAWYSAGFPGSARVRSQVNQSSSADEMRNLITAYFQTLNDEIQA